MILSVRTEFVGDDAAELTTAWITWPAENVFAADAAVVVCVDVTATADNPVTVAAVPVIVGTICTATVNVPVPEYQVIELIVPANGVLTVNQYVPFATTAPPFHAISRVLEVGVE